MKSENIHLHVFVGAGGVGKTTLATGFAIGLAKTGRKVALLSIDPARRLQTALGIKNLHDIAVPLDLPSYNGEGKLWVSQLSVDSSLRRWVVAAGLGANHEQKLLEHAFFRTLSEKLGSATDAFAAVRMVELTEEISGLTDIVVDTAPGLHAIEFIKKPEKMLEFLDGRLISVLKMIAPQNKEKNLFNFVRRGFQHFIDGLSFIGGENFILSFAEILILSDKVFLTMSERLKEGVEWLRAKNTSFVLVTNSRSSCMPIVENFSTELAKLGIPIRIIALNRSVSTSLEQDPAFMSFLENHAGTLGMLGIYMTNWIKRQNILAKKLIPFAKHFVEIPLATNLHIDEGLRIEDLGKLSEPLLSLYTKNTI